MKHALIIYLRFRFILPSKSQPNSTIIHFDNYFLNIQNLEFTSPGTRSSDAEEAILSDQKSEVSKSSINYGTLSISMNNKHKYSYHEEEKEEMDDDFEDNDDREDEKEDKKEGEVGMKTIDKEEKEDKKKVQKIEDEDDGTDFNYQEKKRKEAEENKKILEEEMIIESKIKERRERKGRMFPSKEENTERDSVAESVKYRKEKEFCQNLPDKDHFQSIRTFFLTEKVRFRNFIDFFQY